MNEHLEREKTKSLELTEQEIFILKRCVKELLAGVSKSWLHTRVEMDLTLAEGIDLCSIDRKLVKHQRIENNEV